jgi:hypothetical protein
MPLPLHALESWARIVFTWFWLGIAAAAFAAEPPATSSPATLGEPEEEEVGDVTKLAAFNVQADRIEEFGFRVTGFLGSPFSSALPIVTVVFPNTAAAKAGLRPGDRILTTDGKSAAVTIFSLSKWRKLHERKWAEVASGKKSVTWTLEVESAGTKEKRTVKMTVPTAPPRWGATKWQAPEGRGPAVVAEPGPLADLARETLANGIWVRFASRLPHEFGDAAPQPGPFFGYQWTLIDSDKTTHRLTVSQQRGRTDLILERWTQTRERRTFFTDPSGTLQKASGQAPSARWQELELELGRTEFQRELTFWLNDVGRVTGRWPFEIKKSASLVAKADGTTGDFPATARGAVGLGLHRDGKRP